MKRRVFAMFLCLAMTLSFVGCSGNTANNGGSRGNNSGDSTGSVNGNGTSVDKDRIVIACDDVTSLDPMKNWQLSAYYIYWSVYERLTYLNYETGEYEPELAESWEIAEDGLSIAFHLRQGVKWHDGKDFTSKDVKWTIERGIANGTGNYPGVDHVETPDDYTVVVYFSEPESVFMDKQWTGDCCIMPYGCDDSIAQHPIGTGRYKFKEWLSGDHITLEANADYWGEKAGVSELEFRVIPEASAKLIALQSGDIDIAPLQASDVKHVESDKNLLLKSNTSISVNSLGFNCENEYFRDVRVRQAVAYAINRQAIVDGVLEGYGIVMNTPVAVGKVGYYDGMEPYQYDPERAKELLAEAGYADGFTCELTIRDNELVAQLIQADLSAVDIKVTLNQMESSAFTEYTNAGNSDMLIRYRSGGAADTYVNWFESTAKGTGGNVFFYANNRMDELLKSSHTTMDLEARNKVYQEIQELSMEELPLLPLYAATVFTGQAVYVDGFTPDPEGCHDFRTVKIAG